jgi:3',5'-cyclic AMP phosphodiesterase CpdA
MRKLLLVVFLGFAARGFVVAADSPACRRCIVVYGDSRSGHSTHRKIVGDILALHPELVLHTGDLVYLGGIGGQWRTFDDITAPLRKVAEFYAVLGNHDEGGKATFFAILPQLQGRRWLALQRRGVQFLLLDSQAPLGPDDEQRRWLVSQLQNRPPGTLFTVVVMHDPVFSSGPHSPMKRADELAKLFEENRVDLVFSGHDHDYEHSICRGVHYVVTGGGGAPLYSLSRDNQFSKKFASVHHYVALSIDGDTLAVEAFDVNNNKLDSFTIVRRNVTPVAPAAGRARRRAADSATDGRFAGAASWFAAADRRE